MATIDLGKVGLTGGNNWNATTAYDKLVFVLYENDGCGYISLRSNVGVTPGTDVNTWQKATKAGSSIYELCVAQGTFVGTEAEFVAQYNAAVAAATAAATSANTAATNANATNNTVTAAEALRVSAEQSRVTNETARGTAESARATAETARVSAEQSRVSETSAAITSANTATASANTAATNANTKAALANEKATLASEKAALADTKATLANTAAVRANNLSDHPMRISTTTYHWEKWDETTSAYVDTGVMATASPFATFEVNQTTGQLVETTEALYSGPTFSLNQDDGTLSLSI